MKIATLILLAGLAACNGQEQKVVTAKDTAQTVVHSPEPAREEKTDSLVTEKPKPPAKVYSNARFKDVTVTRLGDNKFKITGKGQIFEASFSWVIEDGHNELQKGYTMTDAGAPEWGNFSFIVDAKKERENSTLHLVLFESSAKDGSRQYQLPILLY